MRTTWTIALLILLFTGCVSYHISQDHLVREIHKHEKSEAFGFTKASLYKYTPNNIKNIECTDDKGVIRSIPVRRNTVLKVYMKGYSQGLVDLFFDTVRLKGDTMIGYESRIAAIKHVIPLKKIVRLKVSP